MVYEMLSSEGYIFTYSCSSSAHNKIKILSVVTYKNGIRYDGVKETILSSIKSTIVQTSIISSITAERSITPAPSCTVLAPIDHGLSLTLPSCVLNVPSDDLIAEGDKSDYHIGPLVETGAQE